MVFTQLNRRKSSGQSATNDVGLLTDEFQTGVEANNSNGDIAPCAPHLHSNPVGIVKGVPLKKGIHVHLSRAIPWKRLFHDLKRQVSRERRHKNNLSALMFTMRAHGLEHTAGCPIHDGFLS